MTLPKFRNDLQVEVNRSTNQAHEMVGETVKSAQIGSQRTGIQVHQTEMLIITFTDDAQPAILAGSNIVNITSSIRCGGSCEFKPVDPHVDFDLTWQRRQIRSCQQPSSCSPCWHGCKPNPVR